MHLQRLRLNDWRGVAEREVSFDGGITLIEGPNEAGKSTLIEALRLLLTELHSSKKADVRAIQPAGQDTGSTVCAELELGGKHFEYCKTFNRGGATELRQMGPQPRQWTGREAHEQMTALLDEHLDLTLWQTLLVDQGAAVEQVALSNSSSLAQALDGASGSTTSADSDQVSGTVFEAAQATFEQHYTLRNRKPRFADQQQAVEALRQDLDEARASLAALDEDLRLEARQQRRLEQLAAQQPALLEHATRAAQQLTVVRTLAEQKRELGRQRAAVEGRLAEQQQALEARAAGRVRLSALEQKLERTASTLTAMRAQQQPLADKEAAAQGRQKQARERRSRAQQDLERAELEERLRTLDEQQQHLKRSLKQRQALRQALRNLDEKLAVDPMTPGALNTLRAAETELAVSEQTLKLAATRYQLRASGPLRVFVDGTEHPLAAGETLEGTIVSTHSLKLDTHAELTLEAPAGLGEARGRRDAAMAQLEDLRETLKVPTLAAAVAAAERRAAMAAERTALARQLDELQQEQTIDVLTRRADELRDEELKLRDRLQTAAATEADAERPALPEQRAAVAAIDQELEALEALLAAVGTERKRADTDAREIEQQRIVDTATAAEQRRQLETEARRVSDTELSRTVDALQRDRTALEAQLDTLEQQDSGLSIEDAALLEKNARGAQERAKAQQGELQTALAVTRDRLERARADGRFERVQNLEAALTARQDALTARERRARAALRLWDTLNQHRDAARSAYLAPLKAQLERLGRLVFGADFGVSLSAAWQITERHLNGRSLPFAALSIGAQEQLSILLRLAAAQLVAPSGGIPLFLDDTLGYADPERLGAMTDAIALTAETCQIIILTCDPARYARLGAATVVRFDR